MLYNNCVSLNVIVSALLFLGKKFIQNSVLV